MRFKGAQLPAAEREGSWRLLAAEGFQIRLPRSFSGVPPEGSLTAQMMLFCAG